MEIAFDFDGSLGHLWSIIIVNWLVNVAETFSDPWKHYFPQTNASKFVNLSEVCMFVLRSACSQTQLMSSIKHNGAFT